jgi:hypothetical protein
MLSSIQPTHQSADTFTESTSSDEPSILPEPVCAPRKLIRERVYNIVNNIDVANILSIKEIIHLTAVKQRYLAKAFSPKERNSFIEK